QAVLVEFPIFIAVGAEPGAAVVMPFIGEAHGDAVALPGPHFLDQTIIMFLGPFASQEGDDLLPPRNELRAVAPAAVRAVSQRHPVRITAVPAILGGTRLLRGGFGGEGRQR